MDEITKKALNDFVQRILTAAETGLDFSTQQIPLVVQEWLTWTAWQSGVTALLSGIPILLSIYWLWKLTTWIKICNEPHVEESELAPALTKCIIGGVHMLIMVVGVIPYVFYPSLMLFVKVMVAPRVVILEKFADLVK